MKKREIDQDEPRTIRDDQDRSMAEIHIIRMAKAQLQELIDRCKYKAIVPIGLGYQPPSWPQYNSRRKALMRSWYDG